MHFTPQQKKYLTCIISALVALAIAFQITGYTNADNAWLLQVAERIVSGEILNTDIIETNPPLIVSITIQALKLANFLHVHPATGFIIFINLLAAFSAALTFTRVKDFGTRLAVIFALFFLPGINFGEREHILIILILPYLAALWTNEKRSFLFILIIAVMAATGFALKPFFLLLWGAILLTDLALTHRFSALLNVENMVIAFIIAAYVAWLSLVEKTYLHEVFPLLVKYYSGFKGNAGLMFEQLFYILFLSQLQFWIIYIKKREAITRPVYFANFSGLASLLMIIAQGKLWTNYLYPPFFFGFITNALLILSAGSGFRPLWNKIAAIMFIGVAIIIANTQMLLRAETKDTEKMISLLNTYADGQPAYALSFSLSALYPALTYSHAIYAGHYGHLWMLPGMYEDRKQPDGYIRYRALQERGPDEMHMNTQILSDMANHPPALIIVTDSSYNNSRLGNFKFNFIDYFSFLPAFKQMWKNYEKIDVIGHQTVYRKKNPLHR